jgi:hypothetical protein
MEETWHRGREALQESLTFSKAGHTHRALKIVDEAMADAIRDDRGTWVRILACHAAALAQSLGDTERQIQYEERALPFAQEHSFALYNFAQLLLKHGDVARAKRYATEAYRLSRAATTDADRDLVAAILKDWPGIPEDTS